MNDDDIPGFSHPALATATIPDKGKSRAQPEPEQLAPPSSRLGPAVSGNIGSSSQTTSRPANRQTVGGVQVETRCVLFCLPRRMKGLTLKMLGFLRRILWTNLLLKLSYASWFILTI